MSELKLREPTVEIRIPISANERYFRMTRYLLASIQENGGPLARRARNVLSVSRDTPRRDLRRECPWAADYDIEFSWVGDELFDALSYSGTGVHQIMIPSDADVVVFCDADTFVVGSYDELIWRAYQSQVLLGRLGSWSPFVLKRRHRHRSSEAWWKMLFKDAGLAEPEMKHQHPGWGHGYNHPKHRYCPDYFNFGFVVGPAAHFSKMSETFREDIVRVCRRFDTIHKNQIGMAITLARHELACDLLGAEYNCPPNMPEERLRGADTSGAEDVKVFHYLADGEINKTHFATEESLRQTLDRVDLSPTALVFQRKLRTVHERIVDGRSL